MVARIKQPTAFSKNTDHSKLTIDMVNAPVSSNRSL